MSLVAVISDKPALRPADSADGRLLNLQVLRFLAALLVVVFHISTVSARWTGQDSIGLIDTIGFVGVDVFFVLSGFIIHRSTVGQSGGSAALWFILRRMARIYLPYLVILAIWAPLLFSIGAPQLKDIDWPRSMSLWPGHLRTLAIQPSWSLSFELYFYGLFALVIASGRWRHYALAAIVLGSLWLLAQPYFGAKPVTYEDIFVASPLILEFFLGGAASTLLGRYRTRHWMPILVLAVVGIVGIGMVAMFGWFNTTRQLNRALVLGPLAAMLVYSVACMPNRLAAKSPLVVLGDAAYAVYLIHWPLVWLLWMYWPVEWRDGWGSSVGLWGCLLVTFGSSVAYHLWVERPLLNWARPLLGRPQDQSQATSRLTVPAPSRGQ